ncbi:MAG: hypothetical protein ABSC15_09450 [Terriglobales bacterium]|jgi:hypothetical protein
MGRAWLKLTVGCLLLIAVSVPAMTVQTPATNQSSKPSTISAADIAAAKASGKVWVNLDSGVYHQGGRWYGKTKNGKFMTLDEAKKAGYKAAKRD